MRIRLVIIGAALALNTACGAGASFVIDGDIEDTDTNVCTACEIDADNDGHSPPADCDDEDASIHPGAAEVCDSEDNDCDGQIDEGCGQDPTDREIVVEVGTMDGDPVSEIEFSVAGCGNADLGECNAWWEEIQHVTDESSLRWSTNSDLGAARFSTRFVTYSGWETWICYGFDTHGLELTLAEIDAGVTTDMELNGTVDVLVDGVALTDDEIYLVSFEWDEGDVHHEGCSVGFYIEE